MKRLVGFLSLALALLITGALQAAEMKFGVVDIQRILDTVDEGKRAKVDFEKAMQTRKAELEKRKAEVDKLKQNFEKQKMILSAQALEEKQKDLAAKDEDLRQYFVTINTEMQKKESQLIGEIGKKIKDVVEKFGKEQGYSFIWEKQSLFFFKDASEITPQVIETYNKTYK